MNNSAIYISCGNNDTFGKYCIKNMQNNFDIIINYYGDKPKYHNFYKLNSKHFSKIHTSKFISLKYNYKKLHINKYDCVYVFDDDCKILNGNIKNLYNILKKYNLDLIAPAQSKSGKLSIPMLGQHTGNHVFRYTNFIEMNFPVFSHKALSKYMSVYDGNLCGWGNDWWFCYANDTINQNNCAIYDRILVENPLTFNKKYTYGFLNNERYGNIPKTDIDNYMTKDCRRKQWIDIMISHNIREWNRETKQYIYA